MTMLRPRLTDHYDLPITQAEADFAIPLLDEDLPLYVDPFLLWKSPSQQDNALHTAMLSAFNRLIRDYAAGEHTTPTDLLVRLSECDEAGLGSSRNRIGRRMSRPLAENVLRTLAALPAVVQGGIRHVEITQLLVDGIGKDRISDLACCLLKSFLIDFTIEQCQKHGIPTQSIVVPEILDYRAMTLRSEEVELPVSPTTGRGVLLIPKRWLRYAPWISFDTYFDGGFVKGDDAPSDRVSVLLYNRANYGLVQAFVAQREAKAQECISDPLFHPISVLSAKRRLAALRKLPTGRKGSADKKYERYCGSLLASLLYPQLDFATEQARTDSGVLIRDLIFYNSRVSDFLQDIHKLYGSRQLVFELKNVAELDRTHVNQLNRYLSDEFGRFGIFVTRHPPPQRVQRNLIDLWSGQRRCIIALTDEDLDLMVTLFESRQRLPIEVVKRAYVNFSRLLPS